MAATPVKMVGYLPAAEIRAALERAAAEEHRTLSSLTTRIVAEWLRRSGYLTDHQTAA